MSKAQGYLCFLDPFCTLRVLYVFHKSGPESNAPLTSGSISLLEKPHELDIRLIHFVSRCRILLRCIVTLFVDPYPDFEFLYRCMPPPLDGRFLERLFLSLAVNTALSTAADLSLILVYLESFFVRGISRFIALPRSVGEARLVLPPANDHFHEPLYIAYELLRCYLANYGHPFLAKSEKWSTRSAISH